MKFPLKFSPESVSKKAEITDSEGTTLAILSDSKCTWNQETHRLKQLFDVVSKFTKLIEVLKEVPLPSVSGGASEFYQRFYNWYNEKATPLLEEIANHDTGD